MLNEVLLLLVTAVAIGAAVWVATPLGAVAVAGTSYKAKVLCSGIFVSGRTLARDWARFGQPFCQDGVWGGTRVLPEGWVRLSVTPTPQTPGARYGAGWWLAIPAELGGGTPAAREVPADAFFAIGHEGQVLTVVPSLRLIAVRLGMSIVMDAWDHASFPAALVRAAR
jgi:CubicO group peptidase (beta-lactamase class C family)